MDNVETRSRIAGAIARELGVDPAILGSSRALRNTPLLGDEVVLLETRDDMAALTQRVYEIYMRFPAEQPPAIIGFVCRDVLQRNPAAGWWDINGHAALNALMDTNEVGVERQLLSFIRRIRNGRGQ